MCNKKLALVLIVVFLALSGIAQAAITIDGSNVDTSLFSTTPHTITLTTSNSNDIIILASACRISGTCAEISSITDTAGLTWSPRKRQKFTDGSGNVNELEEWYAKSSGALTSDTVTVNYGSGTISNRISLWGVSGAYFASPFDLNSSVAAGNGSATSPVANTISTNTAHTMVLNLAQCKGNTGCTGSPAITDPTGFTNINTMAVGGGAGSFSYNTYSTTQSSLSVSTAFAGASGSPSYIVITDAITSDAQGGGGSSSDFWFQGIP
jgi:hypothetical protein